MAEKFPESEAGNRNPDTGITERFKQMNRYKVIPGRIMMPKPDKDTDKRPDKNKIISLMNIDTNVLNKILEN